MRKEQAEHDDTELTLIPRIDRNSRQMALSLASRAAEEAPHMLTVIQSQPQGWVLANRPATARRPALPHTFTTSRSVSCKCTITRCAVPTCACPRLALQRLLYLQTQANSL